MNSPYYVSLWERFVEGGADAILAELQQATPEFDYLDFKRSTSTPEQLRRRRLSPEDKKNLGKALGGFANSLGGLIVWGLECDQDIPESERCFGPGLEDGRLFESVLSELVGGATVPGLRGVELRLIENDQGIASLVMMVPMREFGPVRTTIGESDKYFFRTGDRFTPVPHQLLAAMFGRTPPAELTASPRGLPARAIKNELGKLQISMEVCLKNSGIALAEQPAIAVTIESESTSAEVAPGNGLAGFATYGDSIRGAWLNCLAGQGIAVPAGMEFRFLFFDILLKPPFSSDVTITFTVAARDVVPRITKFVANCSDLQEYYENLPMKDLHSEEAWQLLFPEH